MSRPISAYVPCYNNAATLGQVLAGIQAQTTPVDELVVVDDGSTDDSAAIAEKMGARVVRQGKNLGRGAARARAMAELKGEWILCADAAVVPGVNFVEQALTWMGDARVAAVFSRHSQPPARNAAERWRGRHLFKIHLPPEVRHGAQLDTNAALVRAAAVRQVGGYDSRLRHTEDADLGRRLLGAGFDVICDPTLVAVYVGHNSLGQVLERYWRWHAGPEEHIRWHDYFKAIAYSAKVMAREDLGQNDWAAAMISLLCPHQQFWRSWWRQRGRNPGRPL